MACTACEARDGREGATRRLRAHIQMPHARNPRPPRAQEVPTTSTGQEGQEGQEGTTQDEAKQKEEELRAAKVRMCARAEGTCASSAPCLTPGPRDTRRPLRRKE